jgi:hypothetical protein
MPTTSDDRDLAQSIDMRPHLAVEHIEGLDGRGHVVERDREGELVLAQPERRTEIEHGEEHLAVTLLAGFLDGPADHVVTHRGDGLAGELVHGEHPVRPREHAGDRRIALLDRRDRELVPQQPHQPL